MTLNGQGGGGLAGREREKRRKCRITRSGLLSLSWVQGDDDALVSNPRCGLFMTPLPPPTTNGATSIGRTVIFYDCPGSLRPADFSQASKGCKVSTRTW